MNTRFSKWGNSLALRIPASVAKEISVGEGAIVDITVENGCIAFKPVGAPRYDLVELVRRMTEANIHGETSTGAALGNEFN